MSHPSDIVDLVKEGDFLMGLFDDNIGMLQTLIALAPELNVRVSMANLVDRLDGMGVGDELSRDDLLEIIAQGLAFLHDHVGEEYLEGHDLDAEAEEQKLSGASLDEAMKRFREQLYGKNNEGEKE